MNAKYAFGFSLGIHLILLGIMIALFTMPKEAIEEEIVLELAMNMPESKREPQSEPMVSSAIHQPHEVDKREVQTADTSVNKPDIKGIDPIPEPLAVQPKHTIIQESTKSEPVASKRNEGQTTPTPPIPQPSVEEEYLDNHLSAIRDILIKYRKYPPSAVRMKQEGNVRVSFRLKENGSVEDIRIVSGSGFEILDEDALALIERTASYFPKPPKPVRITVPLNYSLKH